MKVVVTGARGLIGQLLLPALASEFDVSGVDRRTRGRGQVTRRNLTSLRAARSAVRGADVVVDLAAKAASDTPWRDVERNNVPVSMNILEAARLEGVQRVIVASSNHVTGLYELDEPYASVTAGSYEGIEPAALPRLSRDVPARPDGFYALGKLLGEAAGRHYSETGGPSVLCLRIGSVNRSGIPTNPRHFATLLSHRDLIDLVRCCICAPMTLRYGVYYGVSANTWRIWEIADAQKELGYAPRDDAEQWR